MADFLPPSRELEILNALWWLIEMDLAYEGGATAGDIRAQVYSWDSFACTPRSCRIFLSRLAARGLIERIEDSPPRWRPLVTRSEFADGVRAATQLRKSATT